MYKNFFKGIIDFILAFMFLIILMPIFIVVSVLIAIKLGLPVFYSQERPGKHTKPFNLYKFRSMTNETDSNGNLLPNDKRLTSFGKKLRATSIDELPSLINVLKGELSIVGPRPLRIRYLKLYTKEQNKRHEVKPGITGYAQANGRSNISWDKKFKMDCYYVKNLSFILDCKIIIQTFLNVIQRKDTNAGEDSFEIPFDEYLKQKKNA